MSAPPEGFGSSDGAAFSTPAVEILRRSDAICAIGTSVYIRRNGFSTVIVDAPVRLKPFNQNESARTPAG